MSKLKLGIAGSKFVGTKIKDLAKKLKKKKYTKTTRKNYETARGYKVGKSLKPYNVRAGARDTKVIPTKAQSQKGSSFKPVKLTGIQGPASAKLTSSGTAESLREDLMRTHGYGPSFNELIRSITKRRKMKGGILKLKRGGDNMPARNKKNFRPTEKGAGMTAAGVAAYRRANPGSKLKTAVTGKVKPGSKAAKRRKSFCARSAGQMKKFPKAAKDPNSRLRQARRRWKC
tara:strand:+ start:2618 stop:3307 length:690 start_codon:yes stop_codon:yes gene_type:complete